MFNNNKDGITYGSCIDICIDCKKENKRTKAGDLEYQEVFKLYNNGNTICYCMDHFKKMLGKYMLVDPNFFEDSEDNDVKENNLLTNGLTNCDTIEEINGKEIVEQIEEPIDKSTVNKKKKATTTKTKKKDDSEATE